MADDGPGRYRFLTFNAPLGAARADAIAGRLAATGPRDMLDIGCGWGELMLRVAERAPDARGLGIDIDREALERGRQEAARRGLADRVTFGTRPGVDAAPPADVVLCVGSSHVFVDTAHALVALRTLVRPGGRLLLGEGYWQPDGPVDAAQVWPDMLDMPDLAGLVDVAVRTGWRPLWIEVSSRDELDAFESGYLADWEEWLLTHPDHPDAGYHRAQADEHRDRWLKGYRSGLGFAFLTLG